jgi:hypothetical protein
LGFFLRWCVKISDRYLHLGWVHIWRSEVNSNCRYRFLNCQTTASCYSLRR